MKKGKVSSLLLAFCLMAVCFVACDSAKTEEPILLHSATETVDSETFDYAREKYQFFFNTNYYIIENENDYLAFQADVIVCGEEAFAPNFEEAVVFCYPRYVSGSASFIPVEYFYDEKKNEVVRENTYRPEEGVVFPDVVIAQCIDFVEVPKNVFEKLSAD